MKPLNYVFAQFKVSVPYKFRFTSMLLFVYRNRIAQVSFHSATDVLTPELNDNQFHSYYSAIPVQPFDDEQSPTHSFSNPISFLFSKQSFQHYKCNIIGSLRGIRSNNIFVRYNRLIHIHFSPTLKHRKKKKTPSFQNLCSKTIILSYTFYPSDKFFYQSVYFIRLVGVGIMTSILYPFKR